MLEEVQSELAQTAMDLGPIVVILGFFWMRFLKLDRRTARRALIGIVQLALGLTLFRIGLDGALVPLGADLAQALAERAVVRGDSGSFAVIVGFAVALGGTAALIEPTLASTADRVRDLSGGALRPMILRIAVATGIGVGLGLGVLRIIVGVPLGLVLPLLVLLLVILALLAPRGLVPLALDSGAIATSVVTVPIIAAYGIAVAEALPDRSALSDGFGLIVMSMIGSAITVLAMATVEARISRARDTAKERGHS